MKGMLKGAMRDEKGKVLIMVLVLLVLGGLIIPPLLGLMSTGLASGQVYEKKTHEYYAADAGIELGKLAVLNGTVETFELNRSDVEVVIEEQPFDANKWGAFDLAEEYRVFHINSIASFIGDDSSTTVDCYYAIVPKSTCIPDPDLPPDGEWEDYSGSGNIQGGYVTVAANTTLEGDIQVGARVWNSGGFDMTGNVQEGSDVNVTDGDFSMGGSVQGDGIKGSRLFVFGDGHIEGNVQMESVVYVSGDLTVEGNIQEGSVVYVDGNLTVTGSICWDSSYGDSMVGVGGNLTMETGDIFNNVYVAGTVTFGAGGWKDSADKLPFGDFPSYIINDEDKLNNFLCPLEIVVIIAGDPVTLTLDIT